ncbi:MAG: IS200/IS605 family transposase [Cyclobacteriaceae bacterium]
MSQSQVDIYVHVIFATKGREPMILPEYEADIYERLCVDLNKMGSEVIAINGMQEHIHILLKLPSSKSIAETIGWCKGETSHWFNNEKMKHQDHKLFWQDSYVAFSVSKKELKQMRRYVENQQAIHERHLFSEEIEILKGKQKWTENEL